MDTILPSLSFTVVIKSLYPYFSITSSIVSCTICVAVDFASLKHNWLNVGPIVFIKYTTVNNAVTNTNINILYFLERFIFFLE